MSSTNVILLSTDSDQLAQRAVGFFNARSVSDLTARGAGPSLPREWRCARMARRDDREYRYLKEEKPMRRRSNTDGVAPRAANAARARRRTCSGSSRGAA